MRGVVRSLWFVESERLILRVVGYMVAGVVALGTAGTLFINAVAKTASLDTLVLFLPLVVFAAIGLGAAWGLLSIWLFIRAKFNDSE